MQNDEETIVVQDEEQVDTVEVEEVDESAETIETEEEALAKAQAEAAKYRRLFEKSQKKPAEQTKPQATPANVEEVVLLANGMDETLMEQLKKVAAINNTSLLKAQNDPIFVAVKEKFEREKKSSSASLGASRGSGAVKAQKGLNTPGLTREEHMRLAKEAI
jgi:predicted RNase H-like HicB family nuclease